MPEECSYFTNEKYANYYTHTHCINVIYFSMKMTGSQYVHTHTHMAGLLQKTDQKQRQQWYQWYLHESGCLNKLVDMGEIRLSSKSEINLQFQSFPALQNSKKKKKEEEKLPSASLQ